MVVFISYVCDLTHCVFESGSVQSNLAVFFTQVVMT